MDYITYFSPLQGKRKKNIVFDRKKHISFLPCFYFKKFRKLLFKAENASLFTGNKPYSLAFPRGYPRIPKICVWLFSVGQRIIGNE